MAKKGNIGAGIVKAPGSQYEILKTKKLNAKARKKARRQAIAKPQKGGATGGGGGTFGLLRGARQLGEGIAATLGYTASGMPTAATTGPIGTPVTRGGESRETTVGLFNFLKRIRDFGKTKTEVAEANPFRSAPHEPSEGAGILERAFVKYLKQQRYHRGRVNAPRELADRPTPGGQLAALDQFLYYGETVSLVSSWIAAARYDRGTLELTLFFDDGGAVVVSSISWSEAREFLGAESHGEWIWTNVLMRGRGNKGRTRKPVRHL